MAAAAELPIKTLVAGTHLYRQSHVRPTPTSTGSLEDDGVWSFFAIKPNYGTTTGKIGLMPISHNSPPDSLNE